MMESRSESEFTRNLLLYLVESQCESNLEFVSENKERLQRKFEFRMLIEIMITYNKKL